MQLYYWWNHKQGKQKAKYGRLCCDILRISSNNNQNREIHECTVKHIFYFLQACRRSSGLNRFILLWNPFCIFMEQWPSFSVVHFVEDHACILGGIINLRKVWVSRITLSSTAFSDSFRGELECISQSGMTHCSPLLLVIAENHGPPVTYYIFDKKYQLIRTSNVNPFWLELQVNGTV